MNDLARIEFALHDGYAVTTIFGEVDLSNVDALRRTLDENLHTAPIHIIDLTETTYLDSVTIRLLFHLADRLTTTGQELRIVCRDDATIHRVLVLTDLANRVPVHACIDDALSQSS